MRCYDCGGQFIEQNGDLKLKDKIIGEYTVFNTVYEQCYICGRLLYSPVTMRAIEETLMRIKLKEV